MTKTFNGVWYDTKVLCPKCLVRPGKIKNYGSDQQGFWFKAVCPHCSNVVKWYRKTDLTLPEVTIALGEQMSIFNAGEQSTIYKKKPKEKKSKK